MATPSFRSVWLLTCVAAFSTALHLNQNSIPQFHRSSRVSAHIRCCCAKALSVCLFICVTVISSEEFEACGIPTLPTLQRCFSGTLGRTKRSGWPEAGPAWGTEEWSPPCLLPAFLPERMWLPPQCQALKQAHCAQRPSAMGPDFVPSNLLFPSMAGAVMDSPAEYRV